MSSGYWKLWHDTMGRFFVGFILITLGLCAALLPSRAYERPQPCERPSSRSWQQMRSYYQTGVMEGVTTPVHPMPAAYIRSIYSEEMLADGDRLAAACAPNNPNPRYLVGVQSISRHYVDATWTTVTLLMLFVGILLSVGPPFSGESMEAFALTFSLPWSREKWLVNKVLLSAAMLAALTLYALIVNLAVLHFPHVDGLRGGSYGATYIARTRFAHVAVAFLFGLVGVSLGTVASMYARSVLTATVSAGIVAYLLVSVNLGIIPKDIDDLRGFALSSFVIICLAGLLSNERLRRTDY